MKIASELGDLRMTSSGKDSNVQHLAEQLDIKSKSCLDSEMSLKHLNKTLDDLKVNFDCAKQYADSVMDENDSLRTETQSLKGSLEVYEKQIENLRSFIEELESNNKELVRFIDNKNFAQANDYKTRVSELLGKDRCYLGGTPSLHAPSITDKYQDEPNQLG